MEIQKDLPTAHGLLHIICYASLYDLLKAKPEHQLMATTKVFNAMKLCQLVKKTCNGPTAAVVAIENFV